MPTNAQKSPSPTPQGVGLSIIEHLYAKASEMSRKGSVCPANIGLLLATETLPETKGQHREARIIKPSCGMWSCPVCGRRNAARWAVRIYKGVEFYRETEGIESWYFMTLTTRGDRRGFDTSRHDIMQRWPRLYARMKRRQSVIRYVMLPEHHTTDDTLHLHAITSFQPPTDWRLKDQAASVGLGFMADYQPIKDAALVAWYVVKYVTKSLPHADWPKNFRRVRTSHDWPELPQEKSDKEYTYGAIQPDAETLRWLWSLGYSVYAGWSDYRFTTDDIDTSP